MPLFPIFLACDRSSIRTQVPTVFFVSRAPHFAWYPEHCLVFTVLVSMLYLILPNLPLGSTPGFSPWHGWSMLSTTCIVAFLTVYHVYVCMVIPLSIRSAAIIQVDQVWAITIRLYPCHPGDSLRTDFANIVLSRGPHNPANTRQSLTGLVAICL